MSQPARLRRWLRSTRAKAFRVKECVAPDFFLNAAHLSLIEQFFISREITPYLFDLVSQIPSLVATVGVRWFEAYHDERLAGIAALIDSFSRMNVAVLLVADPGEPGVSDILYSALIESTHSRGKQYLNLGPSPSDGHYRFKAKWGAVPAVAPYWYQAWGCGELARGDYYSWPSRLVQYGFRPKAAGAAYAKRLHG